MGIAAAAAAHRTINQLHFLSMVRGIKTQNKQKNEATELKIEDIVQEAGAASRSRDDPAAGRAAYFARLTREDVNQRPLNSR